jgi:hypothetical protein
LIALALEKLPKRYVNAFTTLSMSRNVDLEKFKDMVEAICRANQSKAKSNDDDDEEEFDDKKKEKGSGRKRFLKEMMTVS